MTGKVVCFGELLLRMSPPADGSWLGGSSLPVYVGGAEVNVATALGLWQVPASYVTVLPDNSITSQLLEYLHKKDICTKHVRLAGNRIGLYFLPGGADLKHSGVIYDRAYSSFAELKPGDIDWNVVLDGADWFHFSAISPAISPAIAAVCEEALSVARNRGVTVSVDLNYREKLWKYGLQPLDVMPALVKYCDVVMGNIWAAEKMLGIRVESIGERSSKEDYLRQAEITSKKILASFPQCTQVANTFRFSGQKDEINYYATLYKDNHLYYSSEYDAAGVIERAGSGDCFMAGLIYGNQQQLGSQQLLNFAAGAAFQKLFVPGDSTDRTVEEVLNFIAGYEHR